MASGKRRQDESLEDYRLRLKAQRKAEKIYLRGRWVKQWKKAEPEVVEEAKEAEKKKAELE